MTAEFKWGLIRPSKGSKVHVLRSHPATITRRWSSHQKKFTAIVAGFAEIFFFGVGDICLLWKSTAWLQHQRSTNFLPVDIRLYPYR
jgi:hypothetical protein